MALRDSIDLLRALNDPTRIRLMAVLHDEEMTVAELQQVLHLPQSRVSSHLSRLKEAGLALDRVDGAHRYYRLANGAMPEASRAAWEAVRQPLNGDPQLERDRHRRDEILARRSKSWIDQVAGSLDRHYSPGRTWESLARAMALMTNLGTVADLGAGDGAIAELLASGAEKITAVEINPKMVQAARYRLARSAANNVHMVEADMHRLPLKTSSQDCVLLLQSLQYAERPAEVVREAARVLKADGRILVLTLSAHNHDEVSESYGHLHLGFRTAQLRSWLSTAGIETILCSSAGRERRSPQFEALELLGRKGPANRKRQIGVAGANLSINADRETSLSAKARS
jgi:ubiquinone/menaquinone biosynthesis C-methylase UbiE